MKVLSMATIAWPAGCWLALLPLPSGLDLPSSFSSSSSLSDDESEWWSSGSQCDGLVWMQSGGDQRPATPRVSRPVDSIHSRCNHARAHN